MFMKVMRVADRFKNSDLSLRVGIGAPFGAPLFCVGSGRDRSGTGPAASALGAGLPARPLEPGTKKGRPKGLPSWQIRFCHYVAHHLV
jgi:hypothetical protein